MIDGDVGVMCECVCVECEMIGVEDEVGVRGG